MATAAKARSALLIGVGQYDNSDMLAGLSGPSVDVRNMKSVLEHPEIGGYRVDTLENKTSDEACSRIEDFFRDRAEEETLMLFYSGHGFIDHRGSLYLCTTNSTFAKPKTSTIRADFIRDLIDECACKRVVLLLDCCYSGNFDSGGTAKAASAVEPQFQGTGLGRVVLTAGAEDQIAWDNGETGSVFSHHIFHGLKSGAADTNNDGKVTVQELYEYVYREVTKERPKQRPGKWTYRENGPSFLIAESPIQVARSLPAVITHDLASGYAETRMNALRRLEEFVAESAWAKPLAIEQVRGALDDDSDRVKRVAREFMARLNDGSPPPASAAPPSPPPPAAAPPAAAPPAQAKPSFAPPPPRQRKPQVQPPPPAAPPPQVSKIAELYPGLDPKLWPDAQSADSNEVGSKLRATAAQVAAPQPSAARPANAPAADDFPLRGEQLLWTLLGVFAPLVITGMLFGMFENREFSAVAFVGGCLSVFLAAQWCAVRYRFVASFADLRKRRSWWLGGGAMLLGAVMMMTVNVNSNEVIIGIIMVAMAVGCSCMWRFGARFGYVLSCVIGFFSFILLMLGVTLVMAEWQYDADMRWAAIYVIPAPMIFAMGALARHRALNASGK